MRNYIFNNYVDKETRKFKKGPNTFTFISNHDTKLLIYILQNKKSRDSKYFYMKLYLYLFLDNILPICSICNMHHNNFSSFSSGFKCCCSSKCSRKLAHINSTKTQKEKGIYKIIGKKVSKTYKNKSKEEKQDLVDTHIVAMKKLDKNGISGYNKISLALKNKSKEEKLEIYNKQQYTRFSKSDKELTKINKQTSLTIKNKSKEEKLEIYNKHKLTAINNGTWKDTQQKKEIEIYYYFVNYFTNKSYYKYYKEINPNNLKRGKFTYHLDHKFSILEGFRNNIPPYIIGSRYNLELLPFKENLSKKTKCSITLDDLTCQIL